MSSFVRRLAFGLAFMDYNVVASGAIDSDSQMLWVRNVRDRVEKLAPFLSFDGDPYPVRDRRHGAVGRRRLHRHRADIRTPRPSATTSPSARTAASPASANYVRNSVKAVVDAYDGSVTLYVVDADDPIVRAWMSAFPDLFTIGRRRCPPSCARTCAIPRTSSASRRTCTRSTTSTRPCSSSARARGRWRRRRRWRRAKRRRSRRRHRRRADSASASRRWPRSRRTCASCRTTRCSTTASAANSCCCDRSYRSPATTSAASCRRS